jgi:hypothetical protein
MHIELKTHHQASILLRLLSAEAARLNGALLGASGFLKNHLQNELDAVEGLYKDVFNASSPNKIGG